VRLVRRNCEFCSIPYEPEPRLMRLLSQEQIDVGSFRRGEGCAECKETGYGGRMSLTELMKVNEQIRDSVLEKRATRQIQQIAIDTGMRTLWDSGVYRVLEGTTTLEEVTQKTASDQI